MKRVVGYILLALVYGLIFASQAIEHGILTTAIMWGMVILIATVIVIAVWLIGE